MSLPTGSAPARLAMDPPFRHDHVGSFLRPKAVHEARAAHSAGKITATDLRKVEDDAIAKHVQQLQKHHVRDITDGEFRREYFHLDFLKHLEGISITKNTLEQQEGRVPPTLSITSKLRHPHNIEVANFEYLKTLVPADKHNHIKITIPSPTMCHFRGGRAAISSEVYPDLDEFFADLAACYRAEVDALYKAGCRYLQLDDTNLAYLTDATMRKQAADRGENLDELPKQYAKLINASIASRPEDMVIGIHLCKGNFRSQFFAAGGEEGYNPIAETLFRELNVDAFFLEWENERSGKDFSALKFLPENKTVVLGLVSSKVGTLEDKELLISKIKEAATLVPRGIEQLAISPQCGFSSTVHGNDITEEQQYAKLALCADVAEAVWGAK